MRAQKHSATSTTKKNTNLGPFMPKSKTPRQRFLENLKRGDKIWIVPVKLYPHANKLTWQDTFYEWFDFKGPNGKDCLLAHEYDGPLQFPTKHIFPTKKAAKLFAAPLKIEAIEKRINELHKESMQLYKEWNKLERFLEQYE